MKKEFNFGTATIDGREYRIKVTAKLEEKTESLYLLQAAIFMVIMVNA